MSRKRTGGGYDPKEVRRLAAAADSLGAVGDVQALALLADLADGPMPEAELDPRGLERLRAADLVVAAADGTTALNRKGREVWQSVRSLVR